MVLHQTRINCTCDLSEQCQNVNRERRWLIPRHHQLSCCCCPWSAQSFLGLAAAAPAAHSCAGRCLLESARCRQSEARKGNQRPSMANLFNVLRWELQLNAMRPMRSLLPRLFALLFFLCSSPVLLSVGSAFLDVVAGKARAMNQTTVVFCLTPMDLILTLLLRGCPASISADELAFLDPSNIITGSRRTRRVFTIAPWEPCMLRLAVDG